MDKVYKPHEVEERIYKFWEEGGYFKPKIDKKKKPFVIVQPPPNVTGELHVGHALTATIQDILIRYHRMKGDPTLFLPGVDHAGIATQYILEKELKKVGKTRFDLGREKFTERIWAWIDKYGQRIDQQHRRLGVSVDWSRKRFTFDKDYQKAVKVAFKKLYHDGLIYRGERIINWCPRCQTAISDLENVYKEEKGHLYFIGYPLKGDQGSITVATARPETMLGDTAVAVNPKDRRYEKLVDHKTILPLIKREIPIISDEAVDPEFGTGAVKVTPAHDPVDFEIGERHHLGKIKVIGEDGKITKEGHRYQGLTTGEARQKILADLKKAGFLEKTADYTHNVGHCQRCDTVTESLTSKQWFVKMQPLSDSALKAVEEGRIKIVPKRFEKIYFNWVKNIRDWCISRQIWWGHKIPIKDEEDVLDTWFSSSLWPFATLGWPKKTADFSYFYPTTILETGYDILFFWAARMIMMGLYLTKKEPFKIVFLHGMVRDVLGRKMSKTLGNVMDPLELVDKYGADALRMGLISGTTPGNDMRLYEEKILGYRNFANKIWNIARFINLNFEKIDRKVPNLLEIKNKIKTEDERILSDLDTLKKTVTGAIERYRLSDAGQLVYKFLWHEFADVYLEESKPRLLKNDVIALSVLQLVFTETLKLLHPFMPHITEELWGKLKKKEGALINSSWPQ